jgi:undecaprenyl-phosphate galactose phosphotransferase
MGQHYFAAVAARPGVLVSSTPSLRHYDWHRLHAAAIDNNRDKPSGPVRLPAARLRKRLLDIAGAGALLTLLSPLFIVIIALTLRSGGPVFFGHRRIGASGQPFKCWKFRTMVPDADRVLARLLATDPEARAQWERDFKLRNDPRVTPVGKFLRSTSLDELPQLFNVLMGDMSLVGPRPIVNDEIRRYGAAFHDYVRCRPGITGIWQISGRNDVGYGERVQMDRDYARNWSLLRDLRVLLRTPSAVLRRSGAY